MNLDKFTSLERRSIIAIASIFACRLLGLFMILPVFSVYAHNLLGATPTLIGVALGVYGLTQALLQIPFGMLSDKLGRKPIITVGLGLFGLGSIIAALSHSIHWVIIGRALQGAGAIGSTLIATVADLTRDEQRTKAMAVVGMIIGLSFSAAMLLGPLLSVWLNLNGIFWCTSALALLGIIILHTYVPTPSQSNLQADALPIPALFYTVLINPDLLRLDFGIFILHTILTATFVIVPILLMGVAGYIHTHQWFFYLPIVFLSFLTMLPGIILAEKKNKVKPVFLSGISLLGLSQLGLCYFHQNAMEIGFFLYLFFTGFNLLEATLPSLISKTAPRGSKGTAMGVYSSAQFLGIFVGGMLGGWLYGHHYFNSIFLVSACLAGIWLLIANSMANAPKLAVSST